MLCFWATYVLVQWDFFSEQRKYHLLYLSAVEISLKNFIFDSAFSDFILIHQMKKCLENVLQGEEEIRGCVKAVWQKSKF